MKLLEYEAKQVLRDYGVATPRGQLVRTAEEATAAAHHLAQPVVLKAQVAVAGRGKAGGIRFADDAASAGKEAARLLGTSLKGLPVTSLLVEEKLVITEQYFLSVTIDRGHRRYVVLFSPRGGVDIEEVARTAPDQIARCQAGPVTGFGHSQAERLLVGFALPGDTRTRLGELAVTLFRVALEKDAELVELNPLVRTAGGDLVAADARLIVDDNALFRQPQFAARGPVDEATPREMEARSANLAYVDLDGETGVVGNGAGLVMATVDLVHHFGGRPANFLDIGGGGDVERTKRGLVLVLNKPEVKGVVVNIFGGITRCDIVAEAVVAAVRETGSRKPVAVSLMGTHQEEGNRILEAAGIHSFPSMEEAVAGVLEMEAQ